ncbi:unnamed protein product, partial [marine sediment metagenome]
LLPQHEKNKAKAIRIENCKIRPLLTPLYNFKFLIVSIFEVL